MISLKTLQSWINESSYTVAVTGAGVSVTAGIEDNAAEIISFSDHELRGSVLLLGGLSLGAQIVLEILSQKRDICR